MGGGSHIPSLIKAIEEEVALLSPSSPTHPPTPIRRTLNAAEAVARGCALTAALHSEAFRVARPFVVRLSSHPPTHPPTHRPTQRSHPFHLNPLTHPPTHPSNR